VGPQHADMHERTDWQGAVASLVSCVCIGVGVIEGVSGGNDLMPWHLRRRCCQHWTLFNIEVSGDKPARTR